MKWEICPLCHSDCPLDIARVSENRLSIRDGFPKPPLFWRSMVTVYNHRAFSARYPCNNCTKQGAHCGPAASRPPDTFQSKQECGLDLRSVPLFQDNPSLVSMLTTVDRPRWKTGFYPSSHCSVPYLEKVWLVWLGGGARRPSSGISLYLIKISSKMVLRDEARVREGVEVFPSFWTTQRSIPSPLAPFSV